MKLKFILLTLAILLFSSSFVSAECTSYSYLECYGGNAYWFDSCDNPEYINENRLKFLSSVLKDNRQLVYAKQVHGSHIVSAENVNLTTEADGFFTQSKRFALSVTIADCHPV